MDTTTETEHTENTAATDETPAAKAAETDSEKPTSGRTVEDLEKEIRELRRENASRRTANKAAREDAEADLVDKLAAALGLKKDTKPTVESLTNDIAASETARAKAEAEALTARREVAALRAATAAGANGDALLDSRAFAAKLAEINPDDTEAVSAAVKAALDANPTLRASQAVATATDQPGQAPGTVTQAQFDAMGLKERTELFQTNRAAYDRLAGVRK